uniref:LRAT domain-containing protein n=1 Tax=Panagrolaimus superbus TaxID=310955 RepID=A0A914Y2G7_9BILA
MNKMILDYYDPQEFCEHIESVLRNEWMGDEIVEERLWGETPQKQHLVLIISKALWYAVRLIVDEEYRNLEVSNEYGVYSDGSNNLKSLYFSNYSYRIRKLPSDVIENFEEYLKPGDHIQRNLDGCLPFANHEGVYIGDGMIAHINTEKSTTMTKTLLTEKFEAHARIDPFQGFPSPKNQEIRIVVHCLRRKSRTDICATAHRLADNDVTPEERYYTGEYNFLRQNCQHFASYCVLRIQRMSDNGPIVKRAIIGAANLIGSGVAEKLFFQQKQQKRRESVNSNQTSIEKINDEK